MCKIGYKHSEETKKKLSRQKLGAKNHRFGTHLTTKQKEHLRKVFTGRKHTEEAKAKIIKVHKGKKRSEETRRKLSVAHFGQKAWNKGQTGIYSQETLKKISEKQKGRTRYIMTTEIRRKMSLARPRGIKAWNWNGGTSTKNRIIRKGIDFRLWREAVFKRDNWTCQKYGIKGGELHPHHIKNFSEFPKLRFSIDNGITFSAKAHREFHKRYGLKSNTKKQLVEFLK